MVFNNNIIKRERVSESVMYYIHAYIFLHDILCETHTVSLLTLSLFLALHVTRIAIMLETRNVFIA